MSTMKVDRPSVLFSTISSGVVRASLVHYNTVEEIRRFRDALSDVIDEGSRP